MYTVSSFTLHEHNIFFPFVLSFWGKFGQRPNMAKVSYLKNPADFFDMMTRDDIEVQSTNFVNEEMVEVQWQNTDDFVEPSGRTNVILAAYTTCQARL